MTNPTDRIEIPCPQCAELILREAKKCKHCGAWVGETAPPPATAAFAAATSARPAQPRAEQPIGPMSFGQAVSACFAKYGDFTGRARRAEYWYWVLFTFLANFAVSFLAGLLFGVGSSEQIGLYWLALLSLALPGFTALVRRLHDTNRSGWWYWIILTIIGAIPLLIWLCEEGTPGDNKYGPRTK